MINANIPFLTVLIILFIHWFADFVCQSDKMAVNKSKSNYWLTAHVAVYSVWMIPLGYYLLGDSIRVIMFVWINFSLHWIIDFITSRINSKLWAAGQTHYFFVSVGFDQLLHYACLFGTLTILTKVL